MSIWVLEGTLFEWANREELSDPRRWDGDEWARHMRQWRSNALVPAEAP